MMNDTVTTIRAQRFELLDGEGNSRAVLGLSKAGEPQLRFTDREGHSRMTLGFTDDTHAMVRLFDKNGGERFDLVLGPDGEPMICLRGPNKQAIVLGMTEADTPTLGILNHDGDVIWQAPLGRGK